MSNENASTTAPVQPVVSLWPYFTMKKRPAGIPIDQWLRAEVSRLSASRPSPGVDGGRELLAYCQHLATMSAIYGELSSAIDS